MAIDLGFGVMVAWFWFCVDLAVLLWVDWRSSGCGFDLVGLLGGFCGMRLCMVQQFGFCNFGVCLV